MPKPRRARIQTGRSWLTFAVAALAGILIVALHRAEPRFLTPLESYNYDTLLQQRSHVPDVDDRLILLALDNREEDFITHLREEWEDLDGEYYKDYFEGVITPIDQITDRELLRMAHGRLMQAFGQMGVTAMVWDVAFDTLTSRDPNQISEADTLLRDGLASVPSFLAIEGRLVDTGEQATVRNTDDNQLINQVAVGSQAELADRWPVPYFRVGKLRPNPKFSDAAVGGGHVAYTLEDDGVVRRTPLVTNANNRLFPSLPFAAALHALDPSGQLRQRIRQSGRSILLPLADGDRSLPIDEAGRLRINFIPDWLQNAEVRSYYTTWESVVPFPEDFRSTYQGKIILIGETATYTNDLVTSPLDFELPGVMVLYNVINGVLTGQIITAAPRWLVEGLTIFLGLALGGIYLLRSAWLSVAATASIIIGLLLASPMLFVGPTPYYLPVALPLVSVILAATAATLAALSRAYRWATRLSTILSRFVSPALLEELYRHGVTRTSLAPVRHEITIMFVDIAGFTSLSDTAEPEEISEFLTVWYEEAMAILVENHGTLDKFLGDGVLAYFGAPEPLEDKAAWAARAALALQARFDAISDRLAKSRKTLKIRAGLCTGYATVGYLGGDRFAAYTILGRPVNMAARLEQNCKPGQVTIEKKTWAHLDGRFELEQLEPIHAKGIERPIEAWQVVRELSPDERFGQAQAVDS
ncbi:MAG: adenylate/guanylate cyclase domain-containing protein [Phycisphaeraceae bacterium]